MANKCKFCFTKSKDELEACPVCKLSYNKSKNDLTKEEKKIWHSARNLYILGILFIIFGIAAMIASVNAILKDFENLLPGTISFILAILFLGVGTSLQKYMKWCYIGGIILVSFILIRNIIAINIYGILLNVVYLCIIATPTSKKILYREI